MALLLSLPQKKRPLTREIRRCRHESLSVHDVVAVRDCDQRKAFSLFLLRTTRPENNRPLTSKQNAKHIASLHRVPRYPKVSRVGRDVAAAGRLVRKRDKRFFGCAEGERGVLADLVRPRLAQAEELGL
ncbi:hypothetical protein B0T26DRAFT_399334 [Lasiosphaeria miniovina]|uniref:Uncharacterized protein n=1 Tax=Lasiosphaeria miniovina TaxID=1954250 RepID=A0AA40DQ80_9PEZI|nr:uncharacterized protein B0T26DRAFT_399334 [Lasiosphaeria miniovina]KAK0709222.1 hypothetical protein B0T26DRAFT_399334 [Lasiosphaeria miniovina]